MAHAEGMPDRTAVDRRRLRPARAVGAVVVAGLLAAACGGDGEPVDANAVMADRDDRSTEPATDDEPSDPAAGDEAIERAPEGATGASERPPHELAELAELFDPILAEYDVRVSRGSLIDRWDDATYDRTPDGDHLALYVAAVGDRSAAEYVDGLADLTRALAPLVFERWPGLESFDVCQEIRSPSTDDDEPGRLVTVLDMTREQAAEIDWSSATVADIVAAGEDGAFEGYHVADELRERPEYRRALRQAGVR